jgi:enamine deaminase RidA (YjgF/YER057c/UK114 family)
MCSRASRQNISSGAPWERTVGYSRAVRVGNQVFVAGTAAAGPDGNVIGAGDPYAQAKAIFAKVEAALREAGASFADVVRTRIYVTDADDWEQIGKAHGEVFADIRPASTLVIVAGLVDPEMLVEIEVDAVIVGAGL